MKKAIVALFAIAILAAPAALANKKPINLNEAKPARDQKCLIKVVAFINGQPYAFSRLQRMEYTKVDGTRMTVANPQHPWNDCAITNIGEVTRLSTGLMKSGLNMHVELFADETAKKKFMTTYGDRREAILEKMKNEDYKTMKDYSHVMGWKSSLMYVLPGSAITDNEEPVAIYCKLPPGVTDSPSVPREQRRKHCSTNYLLPGGLGFGYSYIEGLKEYSVAELDKSVRAYFAGTAVKAVKEASPAP